MSPADKIRQHLTAHDALYGHFGIEIVEVSNEYCLARMPLEDRQRNGIGAAHGAAIFALADVAFAAISNLDGQYCTNAQTSISFLAPGLEGPLQAEVRPIRGGFKLRVYEARISDARGTVVAFATMTGYKTGKQLLDMGA